MHIRPEASGDIKVIHDLTRAAFANMAFSDGSEPFIIDALRRDGDLTLSLVGLVADKIIAHIAFSPVVINGESDEWYGLGPVSVHPDFQGQGHGSKLIEHGLTELVARQAKGCVLVGNPDFYSRFGFIGDSGLSYEGIDSTYVQQLAFDQNLQTGSVVYSPGFYNYQR